MDERPATNDSKKQAERNGIQHAAEKTAGQSKIRIHLSRETKIHARVSHHFHPDVTQHVFLASRSSFFCENESWYGRSNNRFLDRSASRVGRHGRDPEHDSIDNPSLIVTDCNVGDKILVN